MKNPARALRIALITTLFLASGVMAQDLPVVRLEDGAEQLRVRFNADAAKVRIITLLSPTCGDCLRGARDLQRDVMDLTLDHELASYVIWVPLEGARERHARRATRLVHDERATHYWDDADALTLDFARVLDIDGDAWDVYLVYGPDATWEEGSLAPDPDYWQHQLFRLRKDAPRFDTDRLREEVQSRLDQISRRPGG